MYTRSLALLFALAMALSLAACGNDETDTPSSAGESADAPYELQMEISQEDWDANRQYIELDTGITMAYVEMGDPDGAPVLLIHGSTDNSRSWSMAAPYFAKAGYHVYMPDLRGHGYTDKPETGMYTVGDYAGDIAAFMEAKGIEKADIVGHSMGSAAAQAFLLTFPEKCGHVVLVSSSPVRARGVGTYEMAIPLGEDEHPSDEFMDSWYAVNSRSKISSKHSGCAHRSKIRSATSHTLRMLYWAKGAISSVAGAWAGTNIRAVRELTFSRVSR